MLVNPSTTLMVPVLEIAEHALGVTWLCTTH